MNVNVDNDSWRVANLNRIPGKDCPVGTPTSSSLLQLVELGME